MFVTTNVYVFPLPLNVPFVPFVTVTSSAVKPVTFSLNVNVYVILFAFVGDFLSAVIITVGASLSIVIVSLFDSRFPFPAISLHTFAFTLTVCVVLPLFVTTNVYVFPLPLNAPFVPFVTSMSS